MGPKPDKNIMPLYPQNSWEFISFSEHKTQAPKAHAEHFPFAWTLDVQSFPSHYLVEFIYLFIPLKNYFDMYFILNLFI